MLIQKPWFVNLVVCGMGLVKKNDVILGFNVNPVWFSNQPYALGGR